MVIGGTSLEGTQIYYCFAHDFYSLFWWNQVKGTIYHKRGVRYPPNNDARRCKLCEIMQYHAKGHKNMRALQVFARHLFVRGLQARMRASMRRHHCLSYLLSLECVVTNITYCTCAGGGRQPPTQINKRTWAKISLIILWWPHQANEFPTFLIFETLRVENKIEIWSIIFLRPGGNEALPFHSALQLLAVSIVYQIFRDWAHDKYLFVWPTDSLSFRVNL